MVKQARDELESNAQITNRNDIFEQETIDEEAIREEAERMDMLMRNLIGGVEEEAEEMEVEQEQQEADSENQDEDGGEFSFRLFSSKPVATVTITDALDNTDDLAKAIADQQVYEFDETDPEFVSRVEQVVVDYDTIVQQSKIPYPTAILPHRVIHLLSPEEQEKKEAAEKKKTIKKRKSKKCRDFEKAVKEGKIKLKPNMRNPATPDGWPGWPGTLTKVAIINYQSHLNKRNNSNGRGEFRGGRGGRGMARGGMPSRGGRGRGRSF